MLILGQLPPCIRTYLSFFSFQFLQLCFGHFGSAKNLQVFLPSMTNKIILTNCLIWPNIVRFCLTATCGLLPCGGLRVAGVWLKPLYWGTVSCRADRPTLSSLSAFAGWHQHLRDPQPLPQGHCLHCRLPQGHTNQTINKHRKVLILKNVKRNIQLFFKPIQIKNSRGNCHRGKTWPH